MRRDFFFNDTATTEIYTLSLHDALPISAQQAEHCHGRTVSRPQDHQLLARRFGRVVGRLDRKSTRLNSSHANISYAVFCLKKKKNHPSINLQTHHIDTTPPHAVDQSDGD